MIVKQIKQGYGDKHNVMEGMIERKNIPSPNKK